MKNITYMNFVLTVIAALLAWNIVIRTNQPVVHAQNASTQFAITELGDPSEYTGGGMSSVEKNLNNAVKGGEIVAVAARRSGGYFVVYKPQK